VAIVHEVHRNVTRSLQILTNRFAHNRRVASRILLVEDDPSIREVTSLGLTAAGFEIVTAADGRAGLEHFRAQTPDAVVLDVMLPVLDGLSVARAIRAESSVPIVMLTARTDTFDVVAGLEAGADDYVRKPFELPELLARLRAALRRTAETSTAVLRLGPLEIDEAGHSVRRVGEDIALSHTEFRLLVELARRPGQVLTRDLLLDRVWGYDYLGDSRLVDVAIQRLRSKVEDDPADPRLILTVRGAGYKAARPPSAS
jgi:two-component system response regulator MtrA